MIWPRFRRRPVRTDRNTVRAPVNRDRPGPDGTLAMREALNKLKDFPTGRFPGMIGLVLYRSFFKVLTKLRYGIAITVTLPPHTRSDATPANRRC